MSSVESSQRFPFVNLKKGLKRAEQLYDADQRGNEMRIPTAFAVWEYSEKSSGGFQTVAALKLYGLLKDTGAAQERKVRLSEDALRFFRDERDEERAKLVRTFALKPRLLRSLWNDWGSEPPSDTVARSHLKIERGLNQQSARTLLRLFKENSTFAGLKGHAKIGPEISDEQSGAENGSLAEAKVGDYVQWASGGIDQFKTPRRVNWVSDDGGYVRVHGSPAGIKMTELTVADQPAPPSAGVARREGASPAGSNKDTSDINVLLTGKRLQITADIDAKGIKKMRDVLAKYEEILKLLQ